MSVNIDDFIPSYLIGPISVTTLLTILMLNDDLYKILDFSARVLTVHNGTQVSDNWTAESLLTSTCAHKKICTCFYPNWSTRVAGVSVQGYDQALSFIRQLNSDNNYTRILRIANTFVNRTNANRGRRQSLHATSSKCLGNGTPAEFAKCYPGEGVDLTGYTIRRITIHAGLIGNSAPGPPNQVGQYSFLSGATWTADASDPNITAFVFKLGQPLIDKVDPGDTIRIYQNPGTVEWLDLYVTNTFSGSGTEVVNGIRTNGTGIINQGIRIDKLFYH